MYILGMKIGGIVGDASCYYYFNILDDCYKIEIHKKLRYPVYFTENGQYLPVMTLDSIITGLNQFGYDDFETMDVVNLINVKKIRRIIKYSYGNIAYFDNGDTGSVSGKMAEKYSHLVVED
ncbi:hypothetical protein [Paenibacillus alba]|uniref:HTH LytTR-type domain-containing protein n=1 Tax=Paenibacillus alba TaxID=1197127 RepID=A0ABU6GAN3_9BACL|nr:hypothetical protein [Paenibacillus alba]MEC0231258.1 hypothetical protein [Paenibacillus alba]